MNHRAQHTKVQYLNNFLWIIILILIVSCQMLDTSENRLIAEYENPTSSMKVIVFENPGNATVRNSIQASIHESDYVLKKEDVGNVFVADKIEGIKKSIDSLLLINWIDNETVEVTYPKYFRIFKMESRFKSRLGEVLIEYKTN